VHPHLLTILDGFFLVFHGTWVLFILTGWIHRRTRIAHLAVCAATALSWVGLGIFYGFGYCPFTEWHWQVLHAQGETGLPRSYLVYLLQRFAGIDPDPDWVDGAAVAGLVIPSLLGIALWWRARRLNTGAAP